LPEKLVCKKKCEEMKSMLQASYDISFLLARKKKNVSDGEVIRESLCIFAEHTGDANTKKMADNISLSRNTVTRCSEEMANDVMSKQIKYLTVNSSWCTVSLYSHFFSSI
jgi:hypothetical protein